VVSADTEDVTDMKKNAIITHSQQTPDHLQVLTPKSYQRIWLTPWKYLAKERRVSFENRDVVLKTNIFSVKQPPTRDDKKSVSCSSERKKGKTSPPPQELKINLIPFICRHTDFCIMQNTRPLFAG
jgi:hypothetical protein